jgi:hypothetical protein
MEKTEMKQTQADTAAREALDFWRTNAADIMGGADYVIREADGSTSVQLMLTADGAPVTAGGSGPTLREAVSAAFTDLARRMFDAPTSDAGIRTWVMFG